LPEYARDRHSRSILQSAPSRLPSRLVALGSRGSRHAARLLYERALATFEKGARIRTSSIAESIENLASFFGLKGISPLPEPLLDTSSSCRGSKRCRRGAATLRAYAGGRRAQPSFVARCAVTSCACLSAQPAASFGGDACAPTYIEPISTAIRATRRTTGVRLAHGRVGQQAGVSLRALKQPAPAVLDSIPVALM
jgi:hypothetical protein